MYGEPERARNWGKDIQITNSHPFVQIPATVQVPDGQTSVSFPVTVDQFTATRSASFVFSDGVLSRTASIHILRGVTLASVSLTPAQVVGGQTVYCKVRLSAPAPVGSYFVQATTSRPFLKIFPTLEIVPGQQEYTFPFPTEIPPSDGAATMTFKAGNVTLYASVKITRPPVAVELSKVRILGGQSLVGTVNTEFGGDPSVVHLACDQPFLQIPLTVTIPKAKHRLAFKCPVRRLVL